MATHGEGEPTDNAVTFHAWLSNPARAGQALRGVRFCAFGLGNRQYAHFNSMGIWADERMAALGAERVHALGLGDDDDDLEADFDTWRQGLWSELGCAETDPEAAGVREPPFAVDWLGRHPDEGWAADWAGDPACLRAPLLPLHQWVARIYPKLGATPVRVLRNDELLRGGGGASSTRHIELALAPPPPAELAAADCLGARLGAASAAAFRGARPLRYAAADDAGIYAQNSADAVRAAAALLRVDAFERFALRPTRAGAAHTAPFPTPCSVGRVLRWYVDLSGPPSKAFLARLAAHATDPAEAAALRRLGSAAGADEYNSWVLAGRRSLLDALAAAPSAALPWAAFIELAPRLQPRYYTIASSPLASPAALHLAVKVVRDTRTAARPPPPLVAGAQGARAAREGFEGVCSGFLKGLRPETREATGCGAGASDLALAFVRPSAFRLPKVAETAVVMVGAGTGLAPFRAFLQELGQRREALPAHASLYFGCQNDGAHFSDLLYARELGAAVGGAALAPASGGRAGCEAVRPDGAACSSAPLSRLRVAFSRAEPLKAKVYVQHLLAADGALLWPLLAPARGGAHVYVCGGTAMGRAVADALAQVAREHGGMSADEARAWLHRLEVERRFVKELWA
jgi:NADPH-ferrihemoprotein reductase